VEELLATFALTATAEETEEVALPHDIATPVPAEPPLPDAQPLFSSSATAGDAVAELPRPPLLPLFAPSSPSGCMDVCAVDVEACADGNVLEATHTY